MYWYVYGKVQNELVCIQQGTKWIGIVYNQVNYEWIRIQPGTNELVHIQPGTKWIGT